MEVLLEGDGVAKVFAEPGFQGGAIGIEVEGVGLGLPFDAEGDGAGGEVEARSEEMDFLSPFGVDEFSRGIEEREFSIVYQRAAFKNLGRGDFHPVEGFDRVNQDFAEVGHG
jgi:hypothetical protein